MNQVSWVDRTKVSETVCRVLGHRSHHDGLCRTLCSWRPVRPKQGTCGRTGAVCVFETGFENKTYWCFVLRAYNELPQPTDVETSGPEYDVPDNEATTETFSPRLSGLVVGKASKSMEPHQETPLLRGTVPIQHERGVIFTEDVELRIAELPNWKPRIVISRRTLEFGDE